MIRVPSAIPGDTTSEAASVQEALFAEMSPTDRVRAALELSMEVRELAKAGLIRRNPGASEGQVKDLLMELCYGSSIER